MPFVLLVPLLEIGDTHVFNPLWPEHARLHEVWQLATNFSLGLACLWLAWIKDKVRAASALALLVTGGLLAAFLLKDLYGGSMRHTDGTEFLVLGINSAVLVMMAASLALAVLAWPGRDVGQRP